MDAEDLQVLSYAVQFGGQAYGADDASHGLQESYNVELSDDMAKLVDKLYNVPSDGEYDLGEAGHAHLGMKMVRALVASEPEDVTEAGAHIELLNRFVPVVRRGVDSTPIENNADDAFDMSLLGSVVAANPDGDVYVTNETDFHPDKVHVVHDIHEQNTVVGIEDEEIRESLVEILGFKTLDEVSLAPGAMKGMGVSENTREEILGRSGTLTDLLRTLSYHMGRLL